MKVTRRMSKFTIDFTDDLLLTKSTETEMNGRDMRDFNMTNIVRVPMATLEQKLKASWTTLKFIWSGK